MEASKKVKVVRLIKSCIEMKKCDPNTHLYMNCLIDIFYETKLKIQK